MTLFGSRVFGDVVSEGFQDEITLKLGLIQILEEERKYRQRGRDWSDAAISQGTPGATRN